MAGEGVKNEQRSKQSKALYMVLLLVMFVILGAAVSGKIAANARETRAKAEENRKKAISSLKEFFNQNIKEKFSAEELGLCPSPITGVHGNTEYLWHIKIGK